MVALARLVGRNRAPERQRASSAASSSAQRPRDAKPATARSRLRRAGAVCHYCHRTQRLVLCSRCRRAFHDGCLQQRAPHAPRPRAPPRGRDGVDSDVDEEPEDFVCPECTAGDACGFCGLRPGARRRGPLLRCEGYACCRRLFHAPCLREHDAGGGVRWLDKPPPKKWRMPTKAPRPPPRFFCPLHECRECKNAVDEERNLIHCALCPTAVHRQCADKRDFFAYNGTSFFVCGQHANVPQFARPLGDARLIVVPWDDRAQARPAAASDSPAARLNAFAAVPMFLAQDAFHPFTLHHTFLRQYLQGVRRSG